MRSICIILSIVVFSSVAVAQPSIDDPKETLFEVGAKQYLAGQFEAAIVSWEKSYAMQPAAIIVYNIALANGKLKNFTQAIAAANRAEADLNQPLDPQTAGKNGANRQAWQMALRSIRATESIRRELDNLAAPVVTSPAKKPIGALGWSGIGAGVLGVAALGTSVVFALQASSGIEDAKDENDPRAHADLQKTTERQQTMGQVFLYSGIGLLAVGTTLFIIDRTTESNTVSLRVSGRDIAIVVSF